MSRQQFLLIAIITLAAGICYAQGFELEYEYPYAAYLGGDYRTPDLNDLDGDGISEVVIRDVSGWPDSGKIAVLDNNYSEIWSYSRSGLSGDFVFKGFADLDGDGPREMLVGYYDVDLQMYSTDAIAYPSGVIRGTLTHIDGYPGIGIFDFDNDGIMEIAVAGASGTSLQIWRLNPMSGVQEQSHPIPRVSLGQNTPNPFNPFTVIKYQVQTPGRVQIDIVDMKGRLVRTLVNEEKQSGDHEVVWDGTDQRGHQQASGSYLYVLHVGEYTASRKLLLLK